MVKKKRVSSSTPLEDIVGYCRAIRYGNMISVSGTAASDRNGKIVGKGDVYAQMVYAIKKIETALHVLEGSLDDVVRTRIFTTDMSRWREIAKAHKEYFGKARPTNTTVQVSGFADPDILVEVEVEAVTQQ
jgi:enamine deaminase RidA (YjgF/YER057c/UK114 family)